MSGKWSSCCCTPPPPPYLEQKVVMLAAPFPGWTKFTGIGEAHSAYETTHYLSKTKVSTDENGVKQTEWETYDADNNAFDSGTTTEDGYIGRTGAITSNHWTATTNSQTWDPSGGFVITLSDSIDLATQIAVWAARFEIIQPFATIDEPNTITTRPYGGGDPYAETSDFTSAGGLSRIQIVPWGGSYPWDETYVLQLYDNLTFVSGSEYNRWPVLGEAGAVGSSPLLGNAGATWNGTIFQFDLSVKPIGIYFTKSLLALDKGLDCGITDYTSGTNYELGDLAIEDYNITSRLVTETAANLVLSPGVYGFDGSSMIVFSGGKVLPVSAVPGIDAAPTNYGAVLFRRVVTTPVVQGMIPDYCP
jgi:hypothetical protein